MHIGVVSLTLRLRERGKEWGQRFPSISDVWQRDSSPFRIGMNGDNTAITDVSIIDSVGSLFASECLTNGLLPPNLFFSIKKRPLRAFWNIYIYIYTGNIILYLRYLCYKIRSAVCSSDVDTVKILCDMIVLFAYYHRNLYLCSN